MKSVDLQPGTRLQYADGEIAVLDHRKDPNEDHHGLPFHTGWWLRDGGGLADFVIDAPDTDWKVLDD